MKIGVSFREIIGGNKSSNSKYGHSWYEYGVNMR